MKFVKFETSVEVSGVNHIDDAIVNISHIARITKGNYLDSGSIKYPESSIILLSSGDRMRVDGTIEEVMEKIKGAE